MRVLVDTCVWSLSLRKRGPADHAAVKLFAALLEGGRDVVLLGIVLQEILQAFKADATFKKMVQSTGGFPLIPLVRDDYVAAARLHRRCAAAGLTTSTVDSLIAAACVRNDLVLLTTDRDFQRIAEHCLLRLLNTDEP